MEDKKVWGILEFKEQTGLPVHHNTIHLWMKALEDEKHLHYIQRIEQTGEKVYDELDLAIVKHIHQRRTENWSLPAIYDDLQNHFELRPFPLDEQQGKNDSQLIDLTRIKKEMVQAIEEMVNNKLESFKQEIIQTMPNTADITKEIAKMLPQPTNKQEERQQRVADMITQRRIEYALRMEAAKKWNEKPEDERMIKVGWFKKEENKEAKEDFIAQYIHQHFEERLKQEYEL